MDESTDPPIESPADYPVETPDAPPARRRRLTAILAIVVAAIVVVGAVGFLFVSGAGPFAHSTGGTPGVTASGQAYSAAFADANASASTYGSGSWTPLFASGVDMSGPLLESTAVPSDLFGGSCPGTNLASSSVVTFDGFSGALSSGTAPDWLFILIGASDTVLVVVVLSGQASVLEKYSGSGCTLFTDAGGVPSSAVDSPEVIQSFMTGGGQAFIGQHVGGFLTMDVFGGYGSDSWSVGYSTCPSNASKVSGAQYNYSQTFFVNNGSATGSPVTIANAHCGGLDLMNGAAFASPGFAPLTSVLGVSGVSGRVTSTGTIYVLNVTEAASYLIWDDLTFSILNATGGVAPGTNYDLVTITARSGCIVATGSTEAGFYSAPASGGCPSGASGGTAGVTTGEVVTISNANILPSSEDTLRVSGAPTFRGLINESIPGITTVLTPISNALQLSSVSMGAEGLSFSVTVTSAASGLILPEVAFQILNSTGAPAVGPYFVVVSSAAGCEIANGEVNSSSFSAPVFYGCSSGTGGDAPLLVGDTVTVSTSPALDGSGYTFVVYGHNLYTSTIEESFDGVVTSLSSSISVDSVSATNLTTAYDYSVNVTSASNGLEWQNVAVDVNTTSGVIVAGPTAVTILNGSGCTVAIGSPTSVDYSAPTTNACSGEALGGSAPVRVGEKIMLTSGVDLVGFTSNSGSREEFQLTGQGRFGGTVFTPIPITGGPIYYDLSTTFPISGSDATGYFYNLTVKAVQGPLLADNLAVGATNGTYVPVSGPFLVNFTAPSGCVLATGPANSTAYTVPTTDACSSGALGAQTPLSVGDSIILYSSVNLGPGHYLAIFAFGTFDGDMFFGL